MLLQNKITRVFAIYSKKLEHESEREEILPSSMRAPLMMELENSHRDQFSLTPFRKNGIQYTMVDIDKALED